MISRLGIFGARVCWLIFPVVGAGLGHVVVLKTDMLHILSRPLDGGATWRGEPLFGAHKTWRGVLVMTAGSAVLMRVQCALARYLRWTVADLCAEYRCSTWIAGGVMGLAYCVAELPNSFCKRRFGIAPGASATHAATLQYLSDQVDSVAGCLLALRLIYRPRRGEMAGAFILGTAIHLGVDRLLFALDVKQPGA